MKKLSRLILMFTLLIALGCSSTQMSVTPFDRPVNEVIADRSLIDGRPYWNAYTPLDTEEFFYVSASATGNKTRQQSVIMNASNTAIQLMAQKVELKVQALQKSFEETVTSDVRQNYASTFSNVNKVTVDQTVSGMTKLTDRCLELDIKGRSNIDTECYVLYRMPTEQTKQAYENALSQDEELYIKFKESKAFDEFKNEFSKIGN
jgi:hypothetical protein